MILFDLLLRISKQTILKKLQVKTFQMFENKLQKLFSRIRLLPIKEHINEIIHSTQQNEFLSLKPIQ